MGDTVPDLPLEVLSNIAALVPPPFYPSHEDTQHQPHSFLVEALDPRPTPATHPTAILSKLSRSSHLLLEASRPWLWEDVDIRSGRGWLSVVNALTEEVEQEEENDNAMATIVPTAAGLGAKIVDGVPTPVSPPNRVDGLPPVQASDAHVQPETVPGGSAIYQPYTQAGPSHIRAAASLPSAAEIASTAPSPLQRTFTYSPPQPPNVAMLLTPPGSRTASPSPNPGQKSMPLPPPVLKSPTTATTAKLRGRSRSPRRSINFDTEGISAVLDRSRSLSSHPPQRIPLERRRTSLSRTRTFSNIDDDDDEEDHEDEAEDEIMPLMQRGASYRREISPPDAENEEESWENVNPELLPMPGPYIRHLSFTNFKTIGSRRTQEEAVRGRFVTAGRLEGVIKVSSASCNALTDLQNAPNLITLCMTEYVDSALSSPVFEELLFRGSSRPRAPRRSSINAGTLARIRSASIGPQSVASTSTQQNQLDPPRPVYVPYETETEEQMWKRRSMFTPMEALDLTGCVSKAFTGATRDFYDNWLADDDDDDEDMNDGRGRSRSRRRLGDTDDDESEVESNFVRSMRRRTRRRPKFTSMKRLSLRACTSLDPMILHDLLLSFPCLTHLDLSNTRVSSTFLMALTDKPPLSLHLQSLSLARCPRLETHVIVDFICRSPAARDLVELNLYVNPTQGNAINSEELAQLLQAPCFKSGRLRYLDLSSAGFSPAHLTPEYFPAQPSLLSLGLSHIPFLPLAPISQFLLTLAPNVEILTLTGTSMEASLRPTASPLQTNLEVHARLINPTTTVPFSLSALSLAAASGPNLNPGPTRLRVVELSSAVRRAINEGGGGHGEWRVVKSKGGRGWYVDSSAGWIQDRTDSAEDWTFVRHLPKDHEWRKWLTSLSDASGRVGSGVGWHSKKMEVIKGLGMMGREEGMAGAGAFAFEE